MTVTEATVIPVGTWSIDSTHSTLEFGIKYLGIATVKGRAGSVAGTIAGGERPSIEGTVDATSITTYDDNRDGHLASPEFFDAERYPELTFSSTDVEARGDELVVRGELTIKGVTQPVELHGRFAGSTTDPWGNERIGLDLEGAIDRTAYGLTFNAPLPAGGLMLGEEVKLEASFSAVKAA